MTGALARQAAQAGVALRAQRVGLACVVGSHAYRNVGVAFQVRREGSARGERCHGAVVGLSRNRYVAEQSLAVLVVGLRRDNDVKAVDAKLDRRIHVDAHECRLLEVQAGAYEAHGRQHQARCKGDGGTAPLHNARRRGLRRQSFPGLYQIVDGGKRARPHFGRKRHLIEGLANALLQIVHERASFRSILPRAIHEYTVLTGASTIVAISGAV